MKKVLLSAFMVLFLTNCAIKQRIADLTVVSTKNVEVSNINLNKAPQKKGVEGKSSRWFFIAFPLSSEVPTIYKAVDDALYNGQGDLMIDTAMYYKVTLLFPFFVKTTYIAKGTVINTTGGQNE